MQAGRVLDSAEAASITPALRSPLSGGFGAQVAQLVEHAIENRSVGGSIPPLGTTTSAEGVGAVSGARHIVDGKQR